MYVFLRSMSSNEDQSAEVKEPEEVEVGERPAVDGVNEAVGGGGDGPAEGNISCPPGGAPGLHGLHWLCGPGSL